MEKSLLDFLDYHKINLDDLYDAKGQTVNQIKNEMKNEDKLFAINTTPCQKGGHTIRDRYSHCIVCETANIAFMKRTRLPGYVYIAGSLSKQFIKIGMSTTQMKDRISRLNSRGVGNTNDWVVIKAIKCDYANSNEEAIKMMLRKYKIDGDYYDGVESNEIFRCSYEKANVALEEHFENNEIKKTETKTFIYNPEKYAFRNLINPKFSE